MADRQQDSSRLLLRGGATPARSRRGRGRLAGAAALLALALPLLALAQAQDPPERTWGDYTVHGSIELGGHIADVQGSQRLYETLVNIDSGPRFLEQELTMQSNGQAGLLFDNLYMSSFGFGGDPEGMARLRLQKNRWYNFVALYRRDRTVFDYNLFANPLNLNQGITTCGVGCSNAFSPTGLPWYTDSTRLQNTTRNMGDFLLTLWPESWVSLRLGYARNASYGLISSTLEAPLRSLLAQDSQWRSDRYQFGVDAKVFPRTTISADFFFEHDKNDISFTDASNLLYTSGNAAGQQILFNGQPLPVDIGILLPPLGGALPSCAGANAQSIFPGDLFRLIAGCNGALLNTGAGGAYFRVGNVRTDIPTFQLSMQSSYFRKVDFTGSYSYSSATSDFLNYNEFAHLNSNQPAAPAPGTVSTTQSNLFLINASPTADRVTSNADLGATVHLTRTLSLSEKFRWVNWREPGLTTQTQYGCFLPSGAAFATAVGTTGTFTSLLNPCFSGILDLINPASGPPLIGTAGSVGNGRGDFAQNSSIQSFVGERSYFNTFKLNWQPSRRFSGYVGYRFARRTFRDGNADITGILSSVTANLVNDGTGNIPTGPRCNVTTAGCDPVTGLITNVGGIDSEEINQHTALLGVTVRPTDAWRINGDLELLYADNTFTYIYPRHQQRARIYSTYKVRPWLSFNGGLHFVETRNDFAGSIVQDDNGATPGAPLFPATSVPAPYGHKDHWRYYTLGATMTKQKFTFDLGWTMLNQNIASATCMPIANNAFSGSVTQPPACGNSATARALLLDYHETTHSGYTHVSYQVTKRVTLNLGYEITADNGRTNWLRSDDGSSLMVVGDIYGNSPPLAGNPITPCPGASTTTGCIFPGPFPDQPLGPQAINWHKMLAGVAVDVTRGVQFKGTWNYYDYNSKDEVPSLSLLQVTAPRDFHANVGTLSLKYSF